MVDQPNQIRSYLDNKGFTGMPGLLKQEISDWQNPQGKLRDTQKIKGRLIS